MATGIGSKKHSSSKSISRNEGTNVQMKTDGEKELSKYLVGLGVVGLIFFLSLIKKRYNSSNFWIN